MVGWFLVGQQGNRGDGGQAVRVKAASISNGHIPFILRSINRQAPLGKNIYVSIYYLITVSVPVA